MAKNKKQRPPSSGILLFVAAFVGALVLCAGIGVLWWTLVKPTVSWWPFSSPDTSDAVATAPEETARFDATDRLTMAVYITDDHHVLQTASLVMVCPDTAQITVSGVPAELSLSEDETDTLGRRFRFASIADAHSAFARRFETTISQYVVLSYADVEAFLTALGEPLIVDLPVDVNEQNTDGSFSVHLTAGENALSAKQVSNLLKCTNYQDGRRERATMHARIIQAYLAQFLATDRSLQSDFSLLISHADTMWTTSQFSATLPRFEYILAEKGEEWLPLIPTTGDFSGAGATLRFAPDAAMNDAIVVCLPDDRIQSMG